MADQNPRSERVLRVSPSVFLLVLLIGGLGVGYFHFLAPRAEKPPVGTSLGPTITQVERLGLLTVLKVSVSDVLEMKGHNYRGAFLVKGDALIAVDMRKIKMSDRNDEQKLITLTLPEPEILNPRVDHTKTMTYDVKGDWFTMIPGWGNEGKLRDAAMYHAQKLVEHAVKGPEYIEQAKSNAEVVLQNIFGFTGWYITIRWEGDTEKPGSKPPAAEPAEKSKSAWLEPLRSEPWAADLTQAERTQPA